MTALTCLSLIFDVAVGYRHSIFILIPTIIVTFIVVTGFCVMAGSGFWPAVLTIAATLTCLQIGYLASAAFWLALRTRSAPARAEFFARRRKAPQRAA
jgi:hypothetical protein